MYIMSKTSANEFARRRKTREIMTIWSRAPSILVSDCMNTYRDRSHNFDCSLDQPIVAILQFRTLRETDKID